jgi:hypothetical protein
VFGIISEHAQLSNHGLAFVIAPSKNLSGAIGAQYLGLLNINDNGKASNNIFAVEFDTVLSPEFLDIDSSHVGIDVNNLQSMTSHTAGYHEDSTGMFLNLTLMSRKDMELNVPLAPMDVAKPKRPLLSSTINLSEVVTDTSYLGFSATTCLSIAYHYTLGWSFSLNGVRGSLTQLPAPDSQAKSGEFCQHYFSEEVIL